MEEQNTKKKLLQVWSFLNALPVMGRLQTVLHFFSQTWRSLQLSPVTFISCLITVTAAMVVLEMMYLLVMNVGDVVNSSQDDSACRIYFKAETTQEDIKKIEAEIRTSSGVENITFIDKDHALKEFKDSFKKYGSIIEEIETNPLPDSLLVTAQNGDVISKLAEEYTKNSKVEYVQYDRDFFVRITQVIRFLKRVGYTAILSLLLIVIVIIANTVRLTLANRSEEIVIMRLVGADTNFVKFPCLIEGSLYGLIGSILGLVVVYFAWRLLLGVMASLPIWQVFFSQLGFISVTEMLGIAVLGTFIGLIGSAVAVWRLAEK